MSVATALRELGLDRHTIATLSKKAKGEGKSAPEYLKKLIYADLSFDEILRPVREGFRRAGGTAEELDELVNEARQAYHTRKRKRSKR